MKKFLLALVVVGAVILGFSQAGQVLVTPVGAEQITNVRELQSPTGGRGVIAAGDYVALVYKGVNISANSTTLLSLPGVLATLPNGIIIKDANCFVATDVRMDDSNVEYGSYAQIGAVFTILALGDADLHSSLGVLISGDETNGVGVGLHNPTGSTIITDVEIVGYVLRK